jgi:hypothetical protein
MFIFLYLKNVWILFHFYASGIKDLGALYSLLQYLFNVTGSIFDPLTLVSDYIWKPLTMEDKIFQLQS